MKVGNTVWSCKSWESCGVTERRVLEEPTDRYNLVTESANPQPGDYVWYDQPGKTVFGTRAEAVAKAEKNRATKLASLAKQAARVRALDFGERPHLDPATEAGRISSVYQPPTNP